MATHDPTADTFHHVRDFPYFELPFGRRIELPDIAGFQLTKFMVLQVVAGLLVLLIFRGLAKRIASGEPARGGWWNFWEMLAVYIRDEVVRPTLGGHGDHGDHGHDDHEHGAHGHAAVAHGMDTADKYLPFVWTIFFYVLFCNRLGAVPWLGSATGNISVTAMLALTTFGVVLFAGTQATGFAGFWKSLVPSMDLPAAVAILLIPMIWVIEVFGLLVKHGVLAIRLFANIMAGHTVIAVILGFIYIAAHSGSDALYYLVLPASLLGQVAIGLLELLVAFIQAYIFAFLATLFISMAVHPH
jgi:F-type H+-transporting ATPase subunit a